MNKYLMAMQGRALGGSIARQTESRGADFYVRTQESARRDAGNATSGRNNDELLELLRELKRDGIRSFVSLSDLDAKQELRNQARKFAKK